MNKKHIPPMALGILAALTGCNTPKPAAGSLENALAQLENKPASGLISPGAMCYTPSSPEDVTYLCPTCHRKTKYSDVWEKQYDLKFLTSHRRTAHQINDLLRPKGYSLTLDETAFCPHCARSGETGFYLIVKKPDGTLVRNTMDTMELTNEFFLYDKRGSDLSILLHFLKGDDTWKGDNNDLYSLKPLTPRIKTLLGLPQ